MHCEKKTGNVCPFLWLCRSNFVSAESLVLSYNSTINRPLQDKTKQRKNDKARSISKNYISAI